MLAGGTAAGQIIAVIFLPVLTRLYTPEDFGVLGVFASILSIMMVIAALRFEIAISLPEEEETAASLLVLSLVIVSCAALISLSLILYFDEKITAWINTPEIEPYLCLIPIGLFIGGIYQVLSYWAIRRKAYSRIAKTKLHQGSGMVVSQAGLGLLTTGPVGLLIGQVVGYGAGVVSLVNFIRRNDGSLIKAITISGMWSAAKRYRRFPLLSSWSALLNSAGLFLPALILAAFYGPQVAGWFVLGQRVIGMPMLLVGKAVAQAYLAESSQLRWKDIRAMQKLYNKTALNLLFIGIAVIGPVGIFAPQLFTWVFGSDWQQAGFYVQLLSVMFIAQLIVVPLSQTLNILERQDLQLIWDAGRFVLVIGAIMMAAISGWPAIHAIGAYGVGMLVSYLLLFWLANVSLRRVIFKNE